MLPLQIWRPYKSIYLGVKAYTLRHFVLLNGEALVVLDMRPLMPLRVHRCLSNRQLFCSSVYVVFSALIRPNVCCHCEVIIVLLTVV